MQDYMSSPSAGGGRHGLKSNNELELTTVLCKQPFFLSASLTKNSLLLQYIHFYVSYDHNFFTDVLSGCQAMFGVPISCV